MKTLKVISSQSWATFVGPPCVYIYIYISVYLVGVCILVVVIVVSLCRADFLSQSQSCRIVVLNFSRSRVGLSCSILVVVVILVESNCHAEFQSQSMGKYTIAIKLNKLHLGVHYVKISCILFSRLGTLFPLSRENEFSAVGNTHVANRPSKS